jgi:hypothetical protein
MVLGKYGKAPSTGLCGITSIAFNRQCCPDLAAAGCNQPNWPQNFYGNAAVNFSCLTFEQPFAMVAISNELNAGRPMNALLQWTGYNATHLIVITGMHGNGDIAYADPLDSGPGVGSLEFLYEACGRGGYWIWTYYDLAPI